jgi:polyhydroxybutyrate depolymerase
MKEHFDIEVIEDTMKHDHLGTDALGVGGLKVRNVQLLEACLLVGILFTTGCSSGDSGAAPESGGSDSGGVSGTGPGGNSGSDTTAGSDGTNTGGAVGTGGSIGGTVSTGGAAGAGGSIGGTSGTGGSTGGASGNGGTAGGSSGAAGGTSVSCPSGGWSPGDQRVTLMHDGIERVYEVHVPPGYTGTTPVPLLLTIHGAHNTPAMVRGWSQMNPVADENGFIVAYPAGIDCWNSGFALPGCTVADDDVGFIMSAVADIESHACIDPKRVYAAGISNGAMMAQRLACEKADVFAAVAGIAGPLGFSPCTPSRPISLVYLHGTEDRTVGYSSARPTVTGWATRNGCTGSPVETYNLGSTVCETYEDCPDGVEVVFCTITGMGHCWPEDTRCGPGGGPEFGVTDFKSSPFMWEFFERHPFP